MTIDPESVVVASEERVSFIVDEADLPAALTLRAIPDNFPESTVRGLPVLSVAVTAHKPESKFRLMVAHPVNPNSRVRLGGR